MLERKDNLYKYSYLKDLRNSKTKSFIKREDYKLKKYLDKNKDLYTVIRKELLNIYPKKNHIKYNFYSFKNFKIWFESKKGSIYIVSQYKKNEPKRLVDLSKGEYKFIKRYDILEDLEKIAIFTYSKKDILLFIYDLQSGKLEQTIDMVVYMWSTFYENRLYYIQYTPNKNKFLYSRSLIKDEEIKICKIPKDLLIFDINISQNILFIEHGLNNSKVLSYKNLNDPKSKIKLLFRNLPWQYKILNGEKNTYILLTFDKKNSSISKIVISSDIKMIPIIKVKNYEIEDAVISKDYISVVAYSNFKRSIIIFNHKGEYISKKEIDLKFKNIYLRSNIKNNIIYITVDNLFTPKKIYKYYIDKGRFVLNHETSVTKKYTSSLYKIKKIYILSTDNFKIPVILIYNKNTKLNIRSPLILDIYGGYNKKMEFNFFQEYLLFLNKGGIYVKASLRGDGDIESRYRKSIDRNKTIEDIIKCTEYLIEKKYTDKNNIILKGESNGGMMSLAAMIKRPKIYKAIISKSPVVDIFEKSHSYFNKNEYGDLDKRNIKTIMKWNPLYNVVSNIKYPDILFIVNLKDKTVPPYHSFMFIKKLSKESSYLIHFNKFEDHTPEATKLLSFEEGINIFVFIFDKLNLS